MKDLMTVGLVIVGLVSSLIVVLEHYWISPKVHPTVRYALGVLAINLPVTVWMLIGQMWPALTVVWIATAAAGGFTLGSYGIDHLRTIWSRLEASELDGSTLREALDGQEDQQL